MIEKVNRNVTGTRYVRLSEIPEPQRTAFMRHLRGAAMPGADDEVGPVAFKIN